MDDLFASQPIAGATLARSDIARLIGRTPRTLIDCDLEEADLSGLDLTRWRFERCNLRRSDLARAKLEGTVWQSCRGPFANFSGANLSEAEFVGGDWNNCSMRRATLTSTRFTGSKLTGADFTEARAMHIHFEEVLLVSAKLPGFSFRKETLRRVDLSGADVRKGDFRMSLETAWLEAQQGFAFKAQPLTICSYRAEIADVLDLTDPAVRERADVTLAQLSCAWERLAGDRKPVPTWELADRLIAGGCAGVIVPSFASRATPDDRNLDGGPVGCLAGGSGLAPGAWRTPPDCPADCRLTGVLPADSLLPCSWKRTFPATSKRSARSSSNRPASLMR